MSQDSAQPLEGRPIAKQLEQATKAEVEQLTAVHGRAPTLAVVLVGEDPASMVYVGRKAKACQRAGITSREIRLPADATANTVQETVATLNGDELVDGILVQLPLPAHIDAGPILRSIRPDKDVDAFHPESVGHALLGDETMAPCTPQGILHLLDAANVTLRGCEVVIINHSNIVGKPLAAMCMNRGATVTVCHKDTRDVVQHTKRADVVVTGTGGARLLRGAELKAGAVVVDVSMNRTADGGLRGDAEPDVWDVASYVTPVPGGVGPMTIAVLLQNTVRAYKAHVGA